MPFISLRLWTRIQPNLCQWRKTWLGRGKRRRGTVVDGERNGIGIFILYCTTIAILLLHIKFENQLTWKIFSTCSFAESSCTKGSVDLPSISYMEVTTSSISFFVISPSPFRSYSPNTHWSFSWTLPLETFDRMPRKSWGKAIYIILTVQHS